MILLIVVLAGVCFGAVTVLNMTSQLRAENEAIVNEAQQKLDAAKAAYDAIDPSTTQGEAHQLEAENAAVAEAEQRANEIKEEIKGLEESIRAAQKELEEAEADEDTAYYMTAYDSMRQGMEMVEGYIEGN